MDETPRVKMTRTARRLALSTLRAALPLAAFLCFAAPAAAQVLRGQVVRAETDRAVRGALVVLLDEQGVQRGAVLTDSTGRYLVRAPAAGAYRLRAEVVGLPVVTTEAIQLAEGQTVSRRVEISGVPIALEPLRATEGRGRCRFNPGAGEATSLLWEEARKALRGAAHADSARLVRYDVVQYRRDLHPETLVPIGEERSATSRVVRTPFASLAADSLAAHGYVRERQDGTFYYGPDAHVLLSDAFLRDHCFELRSTHPGDPRLIGLSFRPAAGRPVTDVEGTLWIDLSTSELRYLEYRYTGLPGGLPVHLLGGRVEFERLEGGAWIVKKWWIRMPAINTNTVQLRTLRDRGVGVQRERRLELAGIREEGGEVVSAAQQAVRTVAGGGVGATLSGVAWDSVSNRPLAGARVFVSGTQFTAVTDSTGAFLLDGVPAGDHTVALSHPLPSALGLFPTRAVSLREGDAVGLDLSVPSGRTLAAQLCPDLAQAGGGLLAGRVHDGQGRPVAAARVTVSWATRTSLTSQQRSNQDRTTDAEGYYHFCGIPAGEPLQLEARLQAASARATLRMPPGGTRHDIRLDPPRG